MIEICKLLDQNGMYRASDLLFNKTVEAQLQISNNMNSPLDTRMIPWSEIGGDLMQRDKDWFTKMPTLTQPEYTPLYDDKEYLTEETDGGTNNIFRAYKKKIKLLKKQLQNPNITAYQKNIITQQINQLLTILRVNKGVIGSQFDQHGPDSVPGPKYMTPDWSSVSMMGLNSFTWKNRRSVNDNSSDSYKNLLPQ